MSWWVLPAVIILIVALIALMIWGVVHCVRNCFYPTGTRGPLEREVWGDTPGEQPRYITHEGPSWKLKTVGPVQVYKD